MRKTWIGAALLTGFALATAPLAAQQRQTSSAQPSIMDADEPDQATPSPQPANPVRHAQARHTAQSMQPDLDANDQLAPSQMKQPMPGAVAEPGGVPRKPSRPAVHAATDAGATPFAPPIKQIAPGAHTVACSGTFAKDSSHLKLAMAYDSKNIAFTEVEASGGSKVPASVLFPTDPKRRLEVWWTNPASRSDTYLIVIGGQSTWSAPGGMRLGLDLLQLEKLNHKPFKLKGFDKDGVATVSDWDGGALAALPGGCKSGVSLRADKKAAADAVRALTADKEYSSADSAIRAVKPTVSEILIGY
jgi:hypothetical protein